MHALRAIIRRYGGTPRDRPMTVAELIAKLQQYPPDLEVEGGLDGQGMETIQISVLHIKPEKGEPWSREYICISLD